MINWLRIFQHLLPNAKAWRITADKQLRRLFEALSATALDVQTFFDNVFFDVYPRATRQLDAYEDQFSLAGNGTTAQRRDILRAAWRATGGQSPWYIQDQLRGAGFDVYVHEWFVPRDINYGDELGATELGVMELGGLAAISGEPVVRDPNSYLANLGTVTYDGQTGRPRTQTGRPGVQTGRKSDSRGYALINRTGAGDYEGFNIPTDPDTFGFFWYVGGENFPDKANINIGRRGEFERLLLQIAPAHYWIGVLVNYTGTESQQ